MGASVPTTNAEPVTVGVTGLLTTLLLPQPVANNAAANETNVMGKWLPCVLKFIIRCLSVSLNLHSANGMFRLGENGTERRKRQAPSAVPAEGNSLAGVDTLSDGKLTKAAN
jgi:uncharacterized protein YacL